MENINNLYETDYAEWAEQQKALLKAGLFDQLDIDNLLEELDEVGGNAKDSLESWLSTMIAHILKYHQTRLLNPDMPEPYNCKEWKVTIRRSRFNISNKLKKTPSLKNHLPRVLPECYQIAVRMAVNEMEPYLQKHQTVSANDFPKTCPWEYKQLMQPNWMP